MDSQVKNVCERCGVEVNSHENFCTACNEILKIELKHKNEKHLGDIEDCPECLYDFLVGHGDLDLQEHEEGISNKLKVFKDCENWDITYLCCPVCKNTAIKVLKEEKSDTKEEKGLSYIHYCGWCNWDGRDIIYIKTEKILNTCPDCKENNLEEVCEKIIQKTPISNIKLEPVKSVNFDFDSRVYNYNNEEIHYQCKNCGYVAKYKKNKMATNESELIRALLNEYFYKN